MSEPKHLKFSPIVRFMETTDYEIDLKGSGIASDACLERYIDRLAFADKARMNLARNVIYLDASLFLILSGITFSIPGTTISLSLIPGVAEVLVVLSSLSFYFLMLAWINYTGYDHIVRSISKHRSKDAAVDPDYEYASRVHFEFVTKIFRPGLNIWGANAFEGGTGYRRLEKAAEISMSLIALAIVGLHLAVISKGLLSLPERGWGYASLSAIGLTVMVVHVVALLLVIGTYTDLRVESMIPSGNPDDAGSEAEEE